ncbi:MAG: tRNA 2-thiouridine(34) synthase MnmA [Planctomycetota bacterium]
MSEAEPQLQPTGTTPLPQQREDAICVLMSGGVDSTLTAVLLREAGHRVVGLTMRLPVAVGCGAERTGSGERARAVAADLAIPHVELDCTAAFHEAVIAPFRAAYAAGRTPSPCVDCNTHIKFGMVARCIRERLGIPRLATGHYARVIRTPQGPRLCRAAVRDKDQSYFLYGMSRACLEALSLPLGELAKPAVRAMAAQRQLPVAASAESMELCFAAGGDYRAALGDAGDRPGPIVDSRGRELGRHPGIRHFTVGQRKGLGVAWTEPLFVLRIEPEADRLVVGTRAEGQRHTVTATRVNVLQSAAYRAATCLRGKLRSGGEPQPCTLVETGAQQMQVRFARPVFAPAPGQHLVLYDASDAIVAGGVIAASAG